MALGKGETLELYRRRAERYDASIWFFRACGVRMDEYRRRTVAALDLWPGDKVVDLGCGTGLNFEFLQRAVGPSGTIVGVDLTDAMLTQARRRVESEGWGNVELVEADIAEYRPPADARGVLSTLALTLVPEYDEVIRTGAEALGPGGRLAILDMKYPEGWPEWLVRVAARLNRPYGVSLDLADRHPWESVRRHMREVEYREFYLGALYLSVGERVSARVPE